MIFKKYFEIIQTKFRLIFLKVDLKKNLKNLHFVNLFQNNTISLVILHNIKEKHSLQFCTIFIY